MQCQEGLGVFAGGFCCFAIEKYVVAKGGAQPKHATGVFGCLWLVFSQVPDHRAKDRLVDCKSIVDGQIWVGSVFYEARDDQSCCESLRRCGGRALGVDSPVALGLLGSDCFSDERKFVFGMEVSAQVHQPHSVAEG